MSVKLYALMRFVGLLIVVLLISLPSAIWAQTPDNRGARILLDKIMATIGDKIILSSDISNQIADMKRQGMEVPTDSDCEILQNTIANKAMVMQALKDSLLVSDDQVEAEMDNKIRHFISMYGSKNELEQIAGRTVFQIKEDFREPIREGLLARNMQAKIMENVKVTPAEVRDFFMSQKPENLPFYELELEIAQIVLYPKADRDIEEYTLQELKEYKRQIEEGQSKFATMAKLYSEDPGSRNNGGRYEISKNEKQWDPVFLSTAFRLKPGQISPVVKSKFGYHIIKMESRYGDDAVVRHILKIPAIREKDIQKTVNALDSIRKDIITHKISFEEAVARYSEDESSSFTGGFIMNREQSTLLNIDQLDRSVVDNLDMLKVGEYSKPIVFNDERGRIGVKILLLKTQVPPHKENLNDDYLKIAAKLTEKKKNEKLKSWLENKVSNFYLHLDKQYEDCNPTLSKWLAASQKVGTEFN